MSSIAFPLRPAPNDIVTASPPEFRPHARQNVNRLAWDNAKWGQRKEEEQLAMAVLINTAGGGRRAQSCKQAQEDVHRTSGWCVKVEESKKDQRRNSETYGRIQTVASILTNSEHGIAGAWDEAVRDSRPGREDDKIMGEMVVKTTKGELGYEQYRTHISEK